MTRFCHDEYAFTLQRFHESIVLHIVTAPIGIRTHFGEQSCFVAMNVVGYGSACQTEISVTANTI